MKIKSFIFILFIINIGCKESEVSQTLKNFSLKKIEFDNSYSITGNKVLDEMIGVQNLEILDSLLLLTTPSFDSLYLLYSLNPINKLGGIIKKGEGPNELNQALKPLQHFYKDNDLVISFYNKARAGLFHLNLTKSQESLKTLFQDTINLEKVPEIYRAYQMTKNEILIDHLDFYNLNQIYSIYNLESRKITSSDTAIISNLTSESDVYLLATVTAFNEKLKKYVSGMIFQDQINIYESKDPQKLLSMSINNNPLTIVENSNIIMPQKYEFYVDIREDDSRIFALYANQTRKSWATGDTPAEIQIIDWNGNPICKLFTKEKLLHLDIDQKNNQLYGLTEKQEVYMYDLNQVPELKASR